MKRPSLLFALLLGAAPLATIPAPADRLDVIKTKQVNCPIAAEHAAIITAHHTPCKLALHHRLIIRLLVTRHSRVHANHKGTRAARRTIR